MRYFILIVLIFQAAAEAQPLVINEWLAANDTTLADADGDFSDWLELYYGGDEPLDFRGYFLTDNAADLTKWAIPAQTLQPKSFLLIFCSGKDRGVNELHTNFKLDKDGEFLALSTLEGIVDSISFRAQRTGRSMGRSPDGSSEFYYFNQATPAAGNATLPAETQLIEPRCSSASGIFNADQSITLKSLYSNTRIHFTTDGSEPTIDDPAYTEPIIIQKTTVIRYRAFHDERVASPVCSRSYFVDEHPTLNDIPLLSVVTDPKNLWDEDSGIIANATQSGDAWERPIDLDIISNGKLRWHHGAGIRIHGGASRTASPKKSFRLYFRSEYGAAKLDYPALPNADVQEYDVLILRGGFNDSWPHRFDYQRESTTYIRDHLVMQLFRDMGHVSSYGDFVHLFLNGEYWGLFNMVERYDDDFMDNHVGDGDWQLIKAREIEAWMTEWREFEQWYKNANFARQSTFDELLERVDLNNVVDYYLLNIWIQNLDWPNNNWYAARDLSQYNAKWIFLPWDSEHTLGGGWGRSRYDENVLQKIDDSQGAAIGNFLGQLRKSPAFRQRAANRFAELRQSTLNENNLNAHLEILVDQLSTAIDFESERWGYVFAPNYEYTKIEWIKALDNLRLFFRYRSDVVREHLSDYYFPEPQTGILKTLADQQAGCMMLQQNHPNPFNNSTEIEFTLPQKEHIELSIYNIRGERVTTLIQNEQQPGHHRVTWFAADVPSGVYFYALNADGFYEKRKCLVIK